jgi:hypothetical protein
MVDDLHRPHANPRGVLGDVVGGFAVIWRAILSSIGPGPVGICPTMPNRSAPAAAAISASAGEAMQQILTRVRVPMTGVSPDSSHSRIRPTTAIMPPRTAIATKIFQLIKFSN